MCDIKIANFFKTASLPFLTGGIVGFAATLISVAIGIAQLEEVLRDNPFGYLAFGSYYCLLGVAGLASFYTDIDNLKVFILKYSVVKWMAGIAGTVAGLSVAALCKSTGQYSLWLALFSLMFAGITWAVWHFEQLVFSETRNEKRIAGTVSFVSAIALVVGTISLCHAWQLVCSCGVMP